MALTINQMMTNNALARYYVKRMQNLIRDFLWKCRASTYPKTIDGQRLLHIGCGDINCPDFINLDARPLPHVHMVRQDMFNLKSIPDQVIDMVYMSHVLEHVPRKKLAPTLREMNRVLKTQGILRISVPDFDLMVQMYQRTGRDMDFVAYPLMGGQDYPYNFHYAVFNKESLTSLLNQCGFSRVREWNPNTCDHHDFEDWASKTICYNDMDFPISLNLEALK